MITTRELLAGFPTVTPVAPHPTCQGGHVDKSSEIFGPKINRSKIIAIIISAGTQISGLAAIAAAASSPILVTAFFSSFEAIFLPALFPKFVKGFDLPPPDR